MKYFRLSPAACILMLMLATSTFAGHMETPRTGAAGGEIHTGIASIGNPIIEIALELCQNLLSLF